MFTLKYATIQRYFDWCVCYSLFDVCALCVQTPSSCVLVAICVIIDIVDWKMVRWIYVIWVTCIKKRSICLILIRKHKRYRIAVNNKILAADRTNIPYNMCTWNIIDSAKLNLFMYLFYFFKFFKFWMHLYFICNNMQDKVPVYLFCVCLTAVFETQHVVLSIGFAQISHEQILNLLILIIFQIIYTRSSVFIYVEKIQTNHIWAYGS